MTSFKEARDLLLVSYYNKLITAEELFILMGENTSHNPEFNYKMHDRFDLETIPEPECRSNFRFDKRDIPVLADALAWLAREVLLLSRNYCQKKNEAKCFVHTFKAISFSVPLCGHDSNVWSTSGRIVSDNKRDFELYLRTSWAQTNRVGPTTFEPRETSNLCGCNLCERYARQNVTKYQV